MPKTMLIDATHSEETRVAVVDGNRLVEYDYESKVRKQLKGSVFLAKVTRVEPSLQAAFVNFGGNRHGFLPFSEIHPDYFRIPVADREALIAAQRAELEEHDEEMEQEEAVLEQKAAEEESGIVSVEEEDDEEEELEAIVEVGGEDKPLLEDDSDGEEEEDDSEEASSDAQEDSYKAPAAMAAPADRLEGPYVEEETASDEEEDESEENLDEDAEGEEEASAEASENGEAASSEDANGRENRGRRDRNRRGRGRGRHNGRGGRGRGDRDDHSVDSLGGDSVDGDRPFRFNLKRNYKIQEVIKRGQIMLIQVSKEERGNKGAAVTTYLSMPGRYCVLMPNSPRGGGVSRKIASFKDRKRMKEMLDDLQVPDGMSVILRTAGVTRTKVEIKRDLDYLTRLWNTIREHTLKSVAPALIYEEGNLIKRAIRDLYSRDIEDVYVSGEEGYKNAKEFMKMLMPSHAKKVQEYKNDRVPMFHKFGVENQIADMGEPTVNLKSGGYLVINPTEALVSVDVNSGRATKERHIEDTALKTNLEAADEVARQLRLRDLGGLVVVDFIDMEDRRNNRKVEQRLRDALSNDRARIQVGRISSFGLLELSRQRLNPSLAEAQQEICAHCAGTGRVKTLDFSAISIIRALEVEGIKGKSNEITLTMATSVALYIMNHKRKLLNDLEERYGFVVLIETDDTMSTSHYTLEGAMRALAPKPSEGIRSVAVDDSFDESAEEEEIEEEGSEGEERTARQPSDRNRSQGERSHDRGEGEGRRRRGRRGGRNRGRRDENGAPSENNGNRAESEEDIDDSIGNRAEESDERDDSRGNREPREGGEGRRRRGRRGGRNRGGRGDRAPQQEGGQLLKESPAPHTDPQFHAAPPIQVVATPSNDTPPPSRDYETVNQAPEKKKKGWWNKLVE
ncbi:MAG: ribonuclease [Micavibrio aeruginosavorus]|uniref:Ribonuclease G n=1 Tax=Micavibrio aeruginosavorus TaxID=349221 RepID=A0A2W5Q3I2_9BACT|nr:MAG: ribonuclease [Micavibrio aeruginosavorus]